MAPAFMPTSSSALTPPIPTGSGFGTRTRGTRWRYDSARASTTRFTQPEERRAPDAQAAPPAPNTAAGPQDRQRASHSPFRSADGWRAPHTPPEVCEACLRRPERPGEVAYRTLGNNGSAAAPTGLTDGDHFFALSETSAVCLFRPRPESMDCVL